LAGRHRSIRAARDPVALEPVDEWQAGGRTIRTVFVATHHPRISGAFERLERETAIKNPGYLTTRPGLTPEEAGLWTRLVWMTGGMAFLSEV